MSKEKASENEKVDANNSWYASTANRLVATLGVLQGEINCDVCVIGAGFTGLSAALELSKKGYSVTLIEAKNIAFSASGRNGGHLIRGYTKSPSVLAAHSSPESAKLMCDLTLESLELILSRISQYKIDCDLKLGHVTAGLTEKHADGLREEIEEWAKVGHADLKLLTKEETQRLVKGKNYIAGLYDPKGAHFHPLNYALGIAQAAQNAGCRIYDKTSALAVEPGSPATVRTPQGSVKAKFVVLGGYVDFKGTEAVNRKVIAATAHMIATEPLGELAKKLIPGDVAVTDANFIMNYFRLSHDGRLLFGGNCNYSGLDYPGQHLILKKRMTDIFPELSEARIDYCWGGPLDITMNRMPHFGRIAPNILYAHGYSGHGIILSNMAGALMAEAIGGTAERFDVFTKIGHLPFLGGDALKRPLFVLGMMWYRLRDFLS